MNRTLMRKDVRLLRPVFLGAAAVGTFMYLGFAALGYYDYRQHAFTSGNFRPGGVESAVLAVQNAAMHMLLSMPLWAAVVGGMAFAFERRERWSEWVGLLPVTRGRLIGSKLVVCLLTCALLFAANGVVAAVAWALERNELSYSEWYRVRGWQSVSPRQFAETAGVAGGVAAMMFGLAWLLSAVLRSAVLAAGISIGASVVGIVLFYQVFRDVFPSSLWTPEAQHAWVVFAEVIPWCIGAVTTAAGVACERWRADP